MIFLCLYICGLFVTSITGTDSIEIVRGVSLQEQSFYDPAKDFTCLDGSKTIPFDSVNDDYCDCVDGSDEPGTSACPEGKFYCQNLGHIAKYIQSSRVNDGICDCCDGSDEYDSSAACFNRCDEEGREERNRRQEELEEHNAGYEVKKTYIQMGADKKIEKKTRSDTLNQLLEERRAKLEELKTIKEAAEAPEKEAKDKHEDEWNEIQRVKKEEQEAKDKLEAFKKLDLDSNGWVQISELMASPYLNSDMSEEDAKDLLGGEALVDGEGFDKVFSPAIKDRYLPDGRPKPTEDGQEDAQEGGSELPKDEGDDGSRPSATDESQEPTEDKMPDYDEATRALIANADKARLEYDEADKEVRELESEQSTLNTYLGLDFGKEDEFAALKGDCFEFTDREYIYKLCPFDRVTQRQKSGGSETDLGRWGNWEDGYNAMKYTGGTGCWNGPARSTLVKLSCGRENNLLSSVEPSRCEYEMEFKTPAMCTQAGANGYRHTEL
ncbi:glucosidase 2 subunit beta-like isoform X2 [Clytia hemisphaerica]|uniref:Glucosidase 2 subunit beta n=1 Tax=Clytia hemisphaerica TaxID=252671 RepID=A0A7M5XNI7_9CNID